MPNEIPLIAGVKIALRNACLILKQNSIRLNNRNLTLRKGNDSHINKAFINGRQAALNGSELPSKLVLLKKYYAPEAVNQYIQGFNSKVGCCVTQANRKARRAGYQAAKLGLNPLTAQQLLRKGYTKEQIESYDSSYKKYARCSETQKLRRVKLAGYQAAKYGCKRPSIEKLKKRGYTQNLISLYYQAFDGAFTSSDEQLKRKAYHMACKIARYTLPPYSEKYLLKRGLNRESIDYFHKIYSEKIQSLNASKEP